MESKPAKERRFIRVTPKKHLAATVQPIKEDCVADYICAGRGFMLKLRLSEATWRELGFDEPNFLPAEIQPVLESKVLPLVGPSWLRFSFLHLDDTDSQPETIIAVNMSTKGACCAVCGRNTNVCKCTESSLILSRARHAVVESRRLSVQMRTRSNAVKKRGRNTPFFVLQVMVFKWDPATNSYAALHGGRTQEIGLLARNAFNDQPAMRTTSSRTGRATGIRPRGRRCGKSKAEREVLIDRDEPPPGAALSPGGAALPMTQHEVYPSSAEYLQYGSTWEDASMVQRAAFEAAHHAYYGGCAPQMANMQYPSFWPAQASQLQLPPGAPGMMMMAPPHAMYGPCPVANDASKEVPPPWGWQAATTMHAPPHTIPSYGWM